MIFGRTVVAASDLKNCTMVNCDKDYSINISVKKKIQISPLRQKKIANFHFSHYKFMGTISWHSNQSSYPTGIKNITFRSPYL